MQGVDNRSVRKAIQRQPPEVSVVVHDIAGYDAFYKKLIGTVPLKNVTSRFAMEKIKSTTSLPI